MMTSLFTSLSLHTHPHYTHHSLHIPHITHPPHYISPHYNPLNTHPLITTLSLHIPLIAHPLMTPLITHPTHHTPHYTSPHHTPSLHIPLITYVVYQVHVYISQRSQLGRSTTRFPTNK